MKHRPRLVPVHVSGWEIGCCVPTPGIGDEVSWFPYLHCPPDPDPQVLDDPALIRQRWRVERSGAGLLVTDGVIAAGVGPMVDPAPDPGDVELAALRGARRAPGERAETWPRRERAPIAPVIKVISG